MKNDGMALDAFSWEVRYILLENNNNNNKNPTTFDELYHHRNLVQSLRRGGSAEASKCLGVN